MIKIGYKLMAEEQAARAIAVASKAGFDASAARVAARWTPAPDDNACRMRPRLHSGSRRRSARHHRPFRRSGRRVTTAIGRRDASFCHMREYRVTGAVDRSDGGRSLCCSFAANRPSAVTQPTQIKGSPRAFAADSLQISSQRPEQGKSGQPSPGMQTGQYLSAAPLAGSAIVLILRGLPRHGQGAAHDFRHTRCRRHRQRDRRCHRACRRAVSRRGRPRERRDDADRRRARPGALREDGAGGRKLGRLGREHDGRARLARRHAAAISARCATTCWERCSATTSPRPACGSTRRPPTAGPGTARCLILVTPDGQRTMATYLGACVELGPRTSTPS